MLVCWKLEIAIVPHGPNCVTEDAELLSRHHRAQRRANSIYLRRRCAAEKWVMRDDDLPMGDAARYRAVCVAALWGGWGAELEFWREGFDKFRGDAFDGEEVIDGADGGLGSGLYDAFGEFFADAGE